jgi:UDP-N-acetylglucosamine 2-epimerase (non-hydrolysing)
MGPVLFVAGARPNFMKIAPVMRALRTRSSAEQVLVHTGQHYDFDMSGVFFEQLRLPSPDVHLQVGSASHGVQTGQIMMSFDTYLDANELRPRSVVVVGDVNSTMACALVAAKRLIPVVHVEAGLRAFDRTMPEEINRVVTDAVADLLLVSEPSGMANLRNEGIDERRLRYCGNVMIDSLVEQIPGARALDMPAQLGVDPGGFALVTLHRPSNVDHQERLRSLVAFLADVSARVPVVFPVHPRTRVRLEQGGLLLELSAMPHVKVIPPLGYREFIGLMDHARVVVTDSGGIQEETTFLGVPCVTMRSNTERPATVSHGTNVLVGDDFEAALRAVERSLLATTRPTCTIGGWDGRAADRIVDALLELAG